MSEQGDIFRPPPMISGKTNISGRDVWYDRDRCLWTTDPAELFMTDEQIKEKRQREYNTRALETLVEQLP